MTAAVFLLLGLFLLGIFIHALILATLGQPWAGLAALGYVAVVLISLGIVAGVSDDD